MSDSRDDKNWGQPEPGESPFIFPESTGGSPPPPPSPPPQRAPQQPPFAYQQAPPPSRPPMYQPSPPRKTNPLKIMLVVIAILFTLGFLGVVMLMGLAKGLPGIGSSIALLEVEGPIYDTRDHMEFVQQFEQKSSMKAMVIRIDSPGGASAATQELYDEIQRVKIMTGKPVVVSMGNAAASGGYYLALAGDHVFATPSTLTGSIGVIMSIPNIEELFDKIGYQPRTIKSGEFKDMGDMAREWTPREKALIQGLIDNVFEQFLGDVVDARSGAIAKAIEDKDLQAEFPGLAGVVSGDSPTTSPVEWFARQVCDGRIFTGEQALTYGFVDEIGGLPDAIRLAEELAGIGHPATVVSSKKPPTFLDVLSGNTKALLEAFGPRHPVMQFRMTLP